MTMSPGDQVEMLKELASIKKMVEDTYKAIAGDMTLGHKGLAQRVEHNEATIAQEASERRDSVKRVHERIDILRDEWAKWKWFAAGLSAGLGAASGFGASWLIERLPG